jgi:hypothetical protein
MSLRTDFQKTQPAKDFAGMFGTASFEAAIQTALLIHAQKYAPEANDGQNAAANAFRIAGAFAFVEVMRSLTILEQPAKPTRVGNLRHDLK